jgi:hypothetical protein
MVTCVPHFVAPLAAVSLQEISVEGVVILLVNLVILCAYAFAAWSMRRLVRQNDEEHKTMQQRTETGLDKLADAMQAERDARHQSFHGAEDRVWGLNTDLKENYQTRREGLRLFGTLSQKLDAQHRELIEAINRLPCMQARGLCPPKEGE